MTVVYFQKFGTTISINIVERFRFEDNVYKGEGGEDSEAEESDESTKGRKKGDRKSDRKKRREDEEYRPDELAFNKSEYFKVNFWHFVAFCGALFLQFGRIWMTLQ